MTYKELQKLHHLCGHTPTKKLLKILENAGRIGENTRTDLARFESHVNLAKRIAN